MKNWLQKGKRIFAAFIAGILFVGMMPHQNIGAADLTEDHEEVNNSYTLTVSFDAESTQVKVSEESAEGAQEIEGTEGDHGWQYLIKQGSDYRIEVILNGEDVKVVAEGYEFSMTENGTYETLIEDVSGDCSVSITLEASEPDTEAPEEPDTIMVNYDTAYGMVFMLSDPDAGMANVDPQESIEVTEGDTVTLQFLPESGYYLSSAIVDKETDKETVLEIDDFTFDDTGEIYTYSFSAMQGKHTIDAVFSEIPQENVDISDVLNLDFSKGADADSRIETNNKVSYLLTSGESVILSSDKGNITIDVENGYTDRITLGEESQTITAVLVRNTEGSLAELVRSYRLNKVLEIRVDKTPPKFENTEVSNSGWTGPNSGKSIEIKGKVTDEGSGMEGVVLFREKKDIQTDKDTILEDGVYAKLEESGDFTFQIDPEDVTSDQTYYLYAIDHASNITEAVTELHYDADAPVITAMEAEDTTSFLDLIFSKKQSVTVTVSASDEKSGVKSIQLTVKDSAGNYVFETPAIKNTADGTAEFTVDGLLPYEEYVFSVVATDAVNNTIETPVTFVKEDSSAFQGVVYDYEAPEISITPMEMESDYYWNGSCYYISGETESRGMTFAVSVRDLVNGEISKNASGLAVYSIRINGQEVTADYRENLSDSPIRKDFTDLSYKTLSNDTVMINLSQAAAPSDGIYTIQVEAVDNAGNPSTETVTVWVDKKSPEINGIKMNDNPVEMEVTADYQTFSRQTVTVTVTGSDLTGYETAGSGIKKIYYQLDSGQDSCIYEADYSDGRAVMQIPSDFKGYIRLTAEDYVGNVSNSVVSAGGIIAESDAKHAEETHIVLETAGTDTKDADGRPLFLQDTQVLVRITDTYSGIQSVSWRVSAPYDTGNNRTGTINVNQSGADGNWTVTEMEQNLITQLEGSIPVTNNSNAILVTVTMTDNAGNISFDSIELSIDKTAPEVTVSFSDNGGDSDYTDMYDENRTATITVRERNFRSGDVQTVITNTDGAVPQISAWSEQRDTSNPDNSIHVATVTFTEDGDYTLAVKYADMAGNPGSSFAQQNFTIDKTDPEIEVSFSGSSGVNGNYYNSERTATIVIHEHNFDAGRVVITGTATDKDSTITFPGVDRWVTAGDTHTASISFGQDGEYSFQIVETDMAGNTAEYTAESYIVDLTEPEIVFSGVEDLSANNGFVAPVITFSDTNFDSDTVSIELEGANHGTMELNGSYSESADGQTFTFANFEEVQDMDDIYTLTASETDRAGNTTTESILFSVNRFGSVYVFGDALKEIEGTYVQKPVDIVLTETNVDRLTEDTIQIVVTKNGTPQTLERDADYQMQNTGGNGSWSQYQYIFDKDIFSGDGTYSITVYSEDAAGNINENIDEAKAAEINFGIDATAPIIEPINIESEKNYNTNSYDAMVSVNDNLILTEVEITIDGSRAAYTNDGENYRFQIPESSQRQNVIILARDAAGNEMIYELADILVSTNVFVRWFNNRALFGGSIITGTVGIAGVGMFIGYRKRRTVRIKNK